MQYSSCEVVMMLSLFSDVYFFVHWLGEDSISVVFSGKVKFEGEANVGKECIITLGKNNYTGEIIAIGKSSNQLNLD